MYVCMCVLLQHRSRDRLELPAPSPPNSRPPLPTTNDASTSSLSNSPTPQTDRATPAAVDCPRFFAFLERVESKPVKRGLGETTASKRRPHGSRRAPLHLLPLLLLVVVVPRKRLSWRSHQRGHWRIPLRRGGQRRRLAERQVPRARKCRRCRCVRFYHMLPRGLSKGKEVLRRLRLMPGAFIPRRRVFRGFVSLERRFQRGGVNSRG